MVFEGFVKLLIMAPLFKAYKNQKMLLPIHTPVAGKTLSA